MKVKPPGWRSAIHLTLSSVTVWLSCLHGFAARASRADDDIRRCAQTVSTVRFDIVDTLGRITLTSPPYNFVSAQFNTDLAAAVHEASGSEIRALLIQAEGPNFSVGGAADEWPGKSYSWFRTFIAEVTNSYRAIEALQIPVAATNV